VIAVRIRVTALTTAGWLAGAFAGVGAQTPQPAVPSAAYAAGQCSNCAAWMVSEAPRRIFGNTYYVGTHGLSAILITSDRGHVLIDGGIPTAADSIMAHVRALGFRVEDIKLILNSHAHFDHAGGIAAIQRASGAAVAATRWSADVMMKGTPILGDPQYGSVLPFPAVANVRVIADGAVEHVGPLALTAHVTAGHTPGGTTWTWQSCEGTRCLDLVYADSQSPVSANGFLFTKNDVYPNAIHDFEHGFATLEELPCDILLTPHPEASDLLNRIAPSGSNPPKLVDTAACARLAASGRAALAKRIETERGATRNPLEGRGLRVEGRGNVGRGERRRGM
jgi:metallo-beta-lactamase class B